MCNEPDQFAVCAWAIVSRLTEIAAQTQPFFVSDVVRVAMSAKLSSVQGTVNFSKTELQDTTSQIGIIPMSPTCREVYRL